MRDPRSSSVAGRATIIVLDQPTDGWAAVVAAASTPSETMTQEAPMGLPTPATPEGYYSLVTHRPYAGAAIYCYRPQSFARRSVGPT